MSESTKQLGIVFSVQQKADKNDSPYMIAWVRRQSPGDVYLHQNNLIDKREVSELTEGRLVFFDTIVKKLERGEGLNAINCVLAQPQQLLEYLLNLDVSSSRQFSRSSSAFRNGILPEMEKLITDATDPQTAIRLLAIKSELLPRKSVVPVIPALPPAPDPAPPATVTDPDSSTFLRHVFTANSSDYASRLFSLLVEGVRAIADDDSFQQALFLLEFNSQLTEGRVADLQTTFYMLAAPTYRFQFWLRGLVPYCDTDTLLTEFATGNETLKQRILERCQGKMGALLAAAAPPVAAPVLHACFRDIKTALLERLSAAQISIRVAVAWFTHDELFAVLYEKLQRNVEVELIINNDYINNGEAGLPFDKFIEAGGKLYLSEHPKMMHHKFCLIDEAVLFNGSYNWTYYADLYNEENVLCIQDSPQVLASFKAEFERLKQHLGGPIMSITPFTAGEVSRFERIGFREYLSKDISSRVAYIQKTRPSVDPLHLEALLTQAVDIDDRNEDAHQLLQAIAPAAAIEGYAIRAQQATRPQSSAAAPQLEVSAGSEPSTPVSAPATPAPAAEAAVSPPKAAVLPSTAVQQPPARPAAPQSVSTGSVPSPVNQPPPASLPQLAVAPARPITSPAPIPAVSTPVGRPTNPPPVLSQPPVNTSISAPNTQRTSARYKNLHLVFALDYSNSMESYNEGRDGYKLYSTGKIQQVINMIFGVAKGLTVIEKVDMFLFEQKSVQLPEITEKNYASYVQDVVMKHERGGTNIYAPIKDIHNKYAGASASGTKVFVILITDGENSDLADNARIKSHFAANHATPIFWQFVGLGAKFGFLEDVASTAPNTDFFKLNDVQSVSNETLLEMLLQKFPQWFEQTSTSRITTT